MADQKVFDTMSWDIFSWLAAEDVFKFRSVSKHCNNFPFDKLFGKKQSNNVKQTEENSFFLQRYCDKEDKFLVDFYTFSNDIVGISNKSCIKFLSLNTTILASSGGLLFCLNKRNRPYNVDKTFLIINPATRTLTFVPVPDKSINWENGVVAFKVIIFENKQDNNIDNFVITIIVKNNEDLYTSYRYSRESKEWKAIGRNLSFDWEVFDEKLTSYFDGAFHYLSYNMETWDNNINQDTIYSPCIITSNLKDGVRNFSNLPKDARSYGLDYTLFTFSWGNSQIGLVKIMKNVFNLWVLEDFERSSWRRILKRKAGDIGLVDAEKVWGCKLMKKNILILLAEDNIYQYRFGISKKFEKIIEFESVGKWLPSCRTTLFPYSISLKSVF